MNPSDPCNHPVCLLACTGGFVDPDDDAAVRARLCARGIVDPAQQADITLELRWAWIEQAVALTDYLDRGVWDGPACGVHGTRAADLAVHGVDDVDGVGHKHHHHRIPHVAPIPLTAENLSAFDRSRLECAAESLALMAQFEATYRSEADASDYPLVIHISPEELTSSRSSLDAATTSTASSSSSSSSPPTVTRTRAWSVAPDIVREPLDVARRRYQSAEP